MDKKMKSLTIRPTRTRILVFHVLAGAAIAVVTRFLTYGWLGLEATFIGTFLVGWIGGGLLMSGHFLQHGTISVWDETIAGPGRFFEGRVMVQLENVDWSGTRRQRMWARLQGVRWIRTTAGPCIRVNTLWYRREDLRRLDRALESFGDATLAT